MQEKFIYTLLLMVTGCLLLPRQGFSKEKQQVFLVHEISAITPVTDTIPGSTVTTTLTDEKPALIKEVPKAKKQVKPIAVPIQVKPIQVIKPKIIKPIIKLN